MRVRVKLPASLKHLTGNQTTLEITATNLMECLHDLVMRYPDLRSRLYNDKDEVHSFINIYINNEDMRFLNGLATTLNDGDEVIIVPAIAGGERALLASKKSFSTWLLGERLPKMKRSKEN